MHSGPLTRLLSVLLPTALGGWLGWSLAEPAGIMAAWWAAVTCSAIGWYYSRRFVRDNLE